jgi:hypothetical protein
MIVEFWAACQTFWPEGGNNTGARRLYDAATIAWVYAACRMELEADRWHRPPSLEAMARREMGR